MFNIETDAHHISVSLYLTLPAVYLQVMEVYPSPQIEVKLTTTSCLSWKSSVVDAVWLEVTSLVPGDTPEEDKVVAVYGAWLIRTVSVQSSSMENVDWLPVMLYSGNLT